MGRKLQSGNVYKLDTDIGALYLQFIRSDKVMGYLIRVLGPHPVASSTFRNYYTFFPLGAAIRRHLVEYVDVSSDAAGDFALNPPMRRAGWIDKNGKVKNWWLVLPGKAERLVDELTEEEATFSIDEIVNIEMLRGRYYKNWAPTDRE